MLLVYINKIDRSLMLVWCECLKTRNCLIFFCIHQGLAVLAHSGCSISSHNKSVLLKDWNWLKSIQRKLVLLSWILTSVSISSNIFINCSIVAFTLLSSLQRASACKSLARKPCAGIMHYCPWGWQKTPCQGTDKAATPWAYSPPVRWATP